MDSTHGNTELAAPGGGIIKVKTDSSNVITATNSLINVDYSISNSIDTDGTKQIVYLRPDSINLAGGKITFRTNSTFSSHPDRLVCLQQALRQWRCATGVNFVLGTDTTFSGDTASHWDNVSMITFGRVDNSNPLAQTFHNIKTYQCASSSDEIVFNQDIDIIVSDSIANLMYADTSAADSVPVGKYDLYAILLHEIGHALSVNHTTDSLDIMYYATHSHGIPPNERKIDLTNYLNSVDGGYYIASNSQNGIFVTNCGWTPMTLGTQNCVGPPWISVNELKEDIGLNMYPNPNSSDNLFIDFSSRKSHKISYSIIDVTGRVVLQNEFASTASLIHEPIDISSLSDGYFIVNFMIGEAKYVTKLIKQR